MRPSRLLAAVLLLTATSAAGSASDAPTHADPDNAALVARGKSLYAQHCASCHGANLEGQPEWRRRLPSGRLRAPPHDATGHTWHHADQQLFDMVKTGTAGVAPGLETDMPVYGGVLSDAEIWAVLSFIESTWPADIRARHSRVTQGAR